MSTEDEIAKTKEPRVADLLQQKVLARLGTVNPKSLQPHVVPVWFLWEAECLWISAFTSTRKVKDLVRNPRCAVLVEPQNQEGSPVQAVLLEGACQLIADQPFVAEMAEHLYEKYLGPEGVKGSDPQSWKGDPENRLIKLAPEKVFVW
jgi:general stress protein 26